MKDWLKTNSDILLIVVVAFIVRFSFVGVLHQQGYTSDEKEYLSLAMKLAGGESFIDSNGDWSTKAPLWPFLLSIMFRVFGDGLLIPQVAVCMLGAGSVFLTFKLGLQLLGNRFPALAAAGISALYPSFVVYSAILQTEALYIVFVLLAFIYVEQMRERPVTITGIFVGVFAALATMTRAVFFGFFVMLLLVLVFMFRKELQRYAGALVAAGIVWMLLLIPWTIRNYNIHETFVPISSWGGISFMLGNNPYSTGTWSTKPGFEEWFSTKAAENRIDLATSTEIQRSAFGTKLGLEFITSYPADAARLWLKKFYMHLVYPISNSDSNVLLQAVCVGGDIVLYLLGGLGLITIRDRWQRFLPLFMAILFFTFLQIALHCEARYRLPIMPFVTIFAGLGVSLLVDTKSVKAFFHILPNRILAGLWVGVLGGLYGYTFWQFLSNSI